MRATLVVLQLFSWLFALTFIGIGGLCIAVVDLLVWLEVGAAAATVHFAVILRRSSRLTSGSVPA